ncbi:MAG: LamG domain-containing protein, partial [Lentisphaeraceae bacterium]|nr:LamG domain-containing protein [Lentisphaeraceae bacterium]
YDANGGTNWVHPSDSGDGSLFRKSLPNSAPSVNAGIDQSITLPAQASLKGSVSDDNLPSNSLSTTWSKVSGPGTVTFANASKLDSTAAFSTAGTYVLRLTATDSALQTSDDISITVLSGSGSADQGMIAWWKFDEAQGTTATDASGAKHHASLANTTWVTGVDGWALDFNGSDSVVNAGVLKTGSSLTLVAWIKPTNLSGDHAIVSRDSSFTFKTSGSNLRFTTPGVRDHTSSGLSLTLGQWQHVAVSFDAGQSAGVKFYINGVLVNAINASSMNVNSNNIEIGENQWSGQSFSGSMDSIRIYSEVKSAANILASKNPPSNMHAGLWYGTVDGNINTTTANPKTKVTLNLSETEDKIATNTTEIYSGEIYDADGNISFTENIDDKAILYIDGVLVLNNASWNQRTSTTNLKLTPGWHKF